MTAGRTVNSQSVNWCTPPKYVDAVRKVFGGKISLDPCSNEWSIVHAETEYRLPEKDGLKESWNYPTIYVNPPYGSDRENGTTIKHWLYKCAHAHKNYGSEILALVPVATNTSHWKEYVWGRATAVCFLYDTRLRFLVDGKDEGKGAPMSCAMIYWNKDIDAFREVFIEYGAVVDLRPLQGKVIGAKKRLHQPRLFDVI
ncbi:MAG: DNA N-6-adenine-methyltransferase [Phycisphaerae bacterium]|nr:DNA N-6-adenine-methyltransferase [Phycisphaerae bacterium]